MSNFASNCAASKPYYVQLLHATTNSAIALLGQAADPSIQLLP